ncbi:MAG: prepilin-type N-terminal cleavage/methylation domain-containing protein [Candidatus Gracilibacteria bacterium]
MKRHLGFSLIELMIVITIIAILSVMGLAAYSGYIKKARDTNRIADIATIDKAILGITSQTGQSPTSIADVITAIKGVNNSVNLVDSLSGQAKCQPATVGGAKINCGYYYTQCDSGAGFAVGVRFETETNQAKYAADGIGDVPASASVTTASEDDDFYSLGNCSAYCGATGCTSPVNTYTLITTP